MSLSFRILALTSAALTILLASCSEEVESCDPPPCPYAVLDLFGKGTVVVTEEGQSPTTYLVGKHCFIRRMEFAEGHEGPTTRFAVTCEAYGTRVSMTVAEDVDPRTFEVGSRSWDASNGAAFLGSVVATGATSYGAFGSLTIDVTESVGGAAPFPELVTPDYRRRFRVTSNAASVGEKRVQIAVDFEVEQTVADRRVDLKAVCGCL